MGLLVYKQVSFILVIYFHCLTGHLHQVKTMDIQQRSRHSTRLPLSMRSCFGLLLLPLVLASCRQQPSNTTEPQLSQQAPQLSQQEPKPSNQPTVSTPKTMSAYILWHSQTQSDSQQSVSTARRARPLTSGQYCFHKAGAHSWLTIRLTAQPQTSGTGLLLTGESAGTIAHPDWGETPYQQSFTGQLVNAQAQVEVTTQIEGKAQPIIETKNETWTVSATQLDMGRVAIDTVPCEQVADNLRAQ